MGSVSVVSVDGQGAHPTKGAMLVSHPGKNPEDTIFANSGNLFRVVDHRNPVGGIQNRLDSCFNRVRGNSTAADGLASVFDFQRHLCQSIMAQRCTANLVILAS
jgi:hypothetical protein